jgi:hypothetical protein
MLSLCYEDGRESGDSQICNISVNGDEWPVSSPGVLIRENWCLVLGINTCCYDSHQIDCMS